MLRQIHIFYKGEIIFTYSYALGLGTEELNNIKEIIKSYIEVPMAGRIFHRPIPKYQIFHGGSGITYFLIVTDLVDSIEYISDIVKKMQVKFNNLFSAPETIKTDTPYKTEFIDFLKQIQKEMHSKIAIIGPIGAGKTTLYNLFKSSQERTIMNFAIASTFSIDELSFDLWHFTLKDNFSPLWQKFIGGSDLLVLLFDASNYNLKVIEHFLTFQKKEGRLSKFIIFANKRDLISQNVLIKIKNDLNLPDIIELSLIDPNAKSFVIREMRETLNLKKALPSNFIALIKEAEKLDKEGNVAIATLKYKELINICNQYQDFSYINTFTQKLQNLNAQKEKQIELEQDLQKKQRFEAPKQIKFEQKITVKALPTAKQPTQANTLSAPKILDILTEKKKRLKLKKNSTLRI